MAGSLAAGAQTCRSQQLEPATRSLRDFGRGATPSPRFARTRAGSTALSSTTASAWATAHRLQVSLGRLSVGQALDAGFSCRHLQRPVRVWRQHHAALAGLHAGAASWKAHLLRRRTGNPLPVSWPVGGGTFHGVSLTPVILRWNFLTRSRRFQPWFQARGRADLYHAQVSAEFSEYADDQRADALSRRRNLRVEFFAAGRRGHSLFHPRQAVDRPGRERRAHLLGLAGRPQPRRQRQRPIPVGLYLLEVSWFSHPSRN